MSLKLENCLNQACPWSGKPVAEDSLTLYRDQVVGFCNPGCRNTFAANPAAHPDATAVFDRLIASIQIAP